MSPFGPATLYKACAMPTASAGPWTVLASYCAYVWRLPAKGTKVFKWPGRAAGCTAASALEDVRARLTGRGRRLWHWVKGRTRVVLPRCQTYVRPALEPHPVLQGL